VDFAGRLRSLREERGLTQAELGQIFGLSKQTISSYENRGSNPDPTTLQRFAQYFDCTTDYLLGRSNTRTPSAKLPAWVSQLPDDIREFFERNPDKVSVYLRLTKRAAETMPPEVLEAFIETFRDVKKRYNEDTGEDLV